MQTIRNGAFRNSLQSSFLILLSYGLNFKIHLCPKKGAGSVGEGATAWLLANFATPEPRVEAGAGGENISGLVIKSKLLTSVVWKWKDLCPFHQMGRPATTPKPRGPVSPREAKGSWGQLLEDHNSSGFETGQI